MATQDTSKRYPVLWVQARVLFQTRRRAWLGICGYSGRVFSVTSEKDIFRPLIVIDLIIAGEVCEEGMRCLDFACPLNKTTRESYAKAHQIRPTQVKRLPEFFETREPIIWNRNADGTLLSFREFLEKYPKGGMVIMERHRRGKGAKEP